MFTWHSLGITEATACITVKLKCVISRDRVFYERACFDLT